MDFCNFCLHLYQITIQIEAEVKSKFEADAKKKIEPINDCNKGMKIIGNMNIPTKAEIKSKNIRFKKPEIEIDVKPKFESNIPVKVEIQDENIPSKKSKLELVVKTEIKPKFEADIKKKIEPIDEEIIGIMNVPANKASSSKKCKIEISRC